jgi:hypothetical protein
MKHINNFKGFKVNEEISDELKQRTADTMREKGWHKRADKLLEPNIDPKIFDEFIGRTLNLFLGLDINGTLFKIENFTIEYGKLNINLLKEGKPTNSKIVYDLKNDTLFGQYIPDQITCDRRTARILCKIAQKTNPNTKYKNGVGDLKIEGWE